MVKPDLTIRQGALVSLAGTVDAATVATLRIHVEALLARPDTEAVTVDLSAATQTDPTLFALLAHTENQLATRGGQLVIIGLNPEVLTSLDEAHLWAVFTLYLAGRRRLPTARPRQPSPSHP